MNGAAVRFNYQFHRPNVYLQNFKWLPVSTISNIGVSLIFYRFFQVKICVWFLNFMTIRRLSSQLSTMTNRSNKTTTIHFFVVYAKYILMPDSSVMCLYSAGYDTSTPSTSISIPFRSKTKTERPFGHNSWLDAFNWWYSREDETVGFYRFELKHWWMALISHRPMPSTFSVLARLVHEMAATEVFNNMFLSFTLTNFILRFFYLAEPGA